MYHCHLRFYLVGRPCDAFRLIRQAPPLEAFTHSFTDSALPDPELAAQADVIVAHLCPEANAAAFLDELCAAKSDAAQLLLLALPEQLDPLDDALPKVQDVWTAPMTEKELRFRFLRWQQGCRTDKELLQARHFLDAAINSVPNLIWFKDRSGVHEMVNDSFCRTVGKTREQVQGRRHAYIWDVEEDDPVCIESEEKVMRTRQTCVSEETVKTGDGTRLLTTYKSPLYDLDGSVMGTVGVAIDVTRERAYEQEIVTKNRILETLFTTTDCGMISQTLDGSRILSINPAALHISGYGSLEELMSHGFDLFSDSVAEEDRPVLRERILSLKEEGQSVSLEYRIRRKTGEILHIMGSAKLVRENGALVCQRFLLDCTEQKLREEKVQAETWRRQLELIQALAIDYSLVCFFDLNVGGGTVLRLNDPTGRMFGPSFSGGLSLPDGIQYYLTRFVHEEDRDLFRQTFARENLKKELTEKNLLHVNYRAKIGDDLKYFEMKAVRAGTWNEVRGVVLGCRCVDEEVRGDMEQRRLLKDALSQANRANKAKSVFLSNMSHDIRTPMNAIVGFTSLAITHIDSREKVEEYLKKIMTSGNHLLSLINDILDMSRIESGKLQLEENPCSLPDILHGLRSILQADVRSKQLELQMDTVDVLHENVFCDKLRLNQVLLNLLGNSVKFTPAGGVVSLRLTEKPGAAPGFANYEFKVSDTGIGMSPEFAAHIFEPFVRERTSTVSGIQGTGLGMAITKNIVDMMAGSIDVTSEVGTGTEFTVCFTFRLHSEGEEHQTIPELEGLRALVVDDDFNCCDSVSYMLQQIGMRAEWTLSGKEAVLRTRQASMRNDNYSIYIVDWLLPDMNGIEVTRRIRQEVGDDMPIIVLTAYDWTDIEEEARQAGVTAFCSKPLFLSELRSCLSSVVSASDAGAEDAAREPGAPRTGRILLAEDNELNQEIAVTILQEAGFEVDVAENGRIAVELLERSQPGYYQVVLMDVRMPVMDGYEATRAIRALPDRTLSSIPVIAMTANAFEEDRQEAFLHGMNAHIPKPINIEVLFQTLDQILP